MASKKEKTESKFYVANKVMEAKEKIEDRVKTVNEKYVQKQIDNGREFFTELKADPVKRIDDLIDDGKDVLKKARETRLDTIQKRVETTRDDVRKKMDTTREDVRKKMDKINTETRKVVDGLENDAKIIVEDLIEMGKKNLDKLPMKKKIEEKFNSGIGSIPSILNLPSKEEIENLVAGIDGVNKKVDAMNKELASA